MFAIRHAGGKGRSDDCARVFVTARASGIYKMASSLGSAFGVAISAALFTALSELDTSFTTMSDLFLGRTDNVAIRFAAAVALPFNVLMVIIAIIAIIVTVPKDDRRESVNV